MQFTAAGEGHRLWIEPSGGVMVASTPMTVQDRVADWERRIGEEPSAEDGQGGPADAQQARSALSSARTQLGMVEDEVADVQAAEEEAKSTQDEEVETAQGSLASTLRTLFELYRDELPDGLTPEDIALHELSLIHI